MPLKHLRICPTCDHVRFAACSTGCRVPLDTDPQSWLPNLQDGAGTMPGEGE